jgi:excisionase family DNA binding protein
MANIDNPVLPAKQAAQHLGISYWTLLDLARQGKIPHFRGGNRLLFRLSTLDQWMTEEEDASIRKTS